MKVCPVCGFSGLKNEPYEGTVPSYEICPCCGFEFGFDDYSEGWTHEQYRDKWIQSGMIWFDPKLKPTDWNSEQQLKNIKNEDKGKI